MSLRDCALANGVQTLAITSQSQLRKANSIKDSFCNISKLNQINYFVNSQLFPIAKQKGIFENF